MWTALSDFAKAEETNSDLQSISKPGLDTVQREVCPIFCFQLIQFFAALSVGASMKIHAN